MVRHRVKIFDAGFITALLAAATLFAFEFDVFETQSGLDAAETRIDLDEMMALSTLLVLCVLGYTFRRAREHARENAKRLAAEKEVMALALHDPLTGLPNRRQFDDALKSAMTATPSAPEAHAVLMIDLNGFKKINDVYGHPAGDRALIHVAARLLRAIRPGDLVARLGGDEFAVLVRNVAGAGGAASLARRIVDGLAAPVADGEARHQLGAGIGVALASAQDATAADELLRRADVALYRAKAERISTVRFFEPVMDERLRERDALERALREAVENDELTMLFRPGAEVEDGRVASFEAQAIWRHRDFGELAPDRYLPVAEDAGLLGRLAEQTLRKACAAASRWPDDVRLSFTLPGALLADPSFGLRVVAALAETRLSPRRLDLEIDEGALIRNADVADDLLAPLREIGVSIVASHFGTGYSDLRRLHGLGLDRVKIDRSFVEAMDHDRKAATMVKALIGIGQGLDLKVVADGVSGERQRAALAAQGCDEALGTLIGGPVSAEEAAAMVRCDEPARARG